MEDSTSNENNLKMYLSGRNEGSMVVVMKKSFKSSFCIDGEEREEQLEGHLVAHEQAFGLPSDNDGCVKRFGKNGRYPKKERCRFGGWWKNHILPQHSEK